MVQLTIHWDRLATVHCDCKERSAFKEWARRFIALGERYTCMHDLPLCHCKAASKGKYIPTLKDTTTQLAYTEAGISGSSFNNQFSLVKMSHQTVKHQISFQKCMCFNSICTCTELQRQRLKRATCRLQKAMESRTFWVSERSTTIGVSSVQYRSAPA